MKTAKQIKDLVHNIARGKNLNSQEVLQMFMFERLIERLSCSKYRENFVIKGGLLISAMIGVSERTTMDMDTTAKGIRMQEDKIQEILTEILNIDVDDNIEFSFKKLTSIRKTDDYNNFKAGIIAEFDGMVTPMKIDITTGDIITPKEIDFEYNFMFEKKSVSVKAYPLETILAEKYETIIRRNIWNTRSRDFYDVYTLFSLKQDQINWITLKDAIIQTATKRNSLSLIEQSKKIIDEISDSEYVKKSWSNYQKSNTYTQKVSFSQVIEIILIFEKTLNECNKL